MITLNELKAFELCTSKNRDRLALNMIYIDAEQDCFTIVAADGRILLQKKYDLSEWADLVDIMIKKFSYHIIPEPTSGFLCTNLKKLKKLAFASGIFTPKSNEIPEYPEYQKCIPNLCDYPPVDKRILPFFSFEVYARVSKILKWIDPVVHRNCYLPDYYDGLRTTVKIVNDFTLLAMPVKY